MNEPNIITIEKNVPIPDLTWGCSKIKYSFVERMEVGDSFYINGVTPDFTPLSVKAHMYKLNSETDRTYTVRTVEGTSQDAKAVRVWRTK